MSTVTTVPTRVVVVVVAAGIHRVTTGVHARSTRVYEYMLWCIQ